MRKLFFTNTDKCRIFYIFVEYGSGIDREKYWKYSDTSCRCFENRPVNLALRCSRESMAALETPGIYTGSGRIPMSSAGDYEYVFLSWSAPNGLQQEVCKLGFY
jgi:hypothetical protein